MKDFGSQLTHQITSTDLEKWLRRRNGEVMKANTRVHLVGLFNYGIKRRHLSTNPSSALTVQNVRRDRRPCILSVAESRKLMNSALEHEPTLIPYLMQMGHGSSTKMLFAHYRRAVREKDALKFWDIRPGNKGELAHVASLVESVASEATALTD